MKVLSIGALFLLVASACGGGAKSGPQRVKNPASLVEKTRVFTDGEDIKLEVLELQEEGKALVRVTGSRSDFEGKVVECEIQDQGRRITYTTQVDGSDWNVLVQELGRSGGKSSWRSYLGAGYRNGVSLTLDVDAGKNLDAVPMYRAYEDQKHDGSLEAFATFNRKATVDRTMEGLRKAAKSAAKVCGTEVGVSVAWDSFDDQFIKDKSVVSYCSGPLDAIRDLCRHEPAKNFVKDKVSDMKCKHGDEMTMAMKGKVIHFTTSEKGSNMRQFARDQLRKEAYKGSTLGRRITLSRTRVCKDEKRDKYVLVTPVQSEHEGVLYGDGKKFTHTPFPYGLSDGWFLEPRFYNPKHNSNIRGNDLRSYSYIQLNKDKTACNLVCGTQKKELALVTGEEAMKIADQAEIVPGPLLRKPYGLARDRRGTYYYVDRSTEKGQERFFQLYVGKKGNVKLQQMRDIVDDSEGMIFSSKKGELRLILAQEKEKATWIRGKRQRELTVVPVMSNLHMIYNELGVYTGKNLGTPCDDLDL